MNTNTDAIIVFDNVKARIALTYPSVMPEDYKYPDDENQLAMARHILQMRHIAERAITEALTQSKIQDVSLNAHGIQHLAHNLWNKRVMEKLKQWRDAVAESVPAQGSSSGIHNRGVQRLYAELLPCHEEVLVVKFLSKNEGYTRRFLNLIEAQTRIALLYPTVNPDDLKDPLDKQERLMTWHVRQIRYIVENALLNVKFNVLSSSYGFSAEFIQVEARKRVNAVLYVKVGLDAGWQCRRR
ncbi:hypothetical protein SBRCBS47491_009745 [Sporothrix bragantina]|uniref:Uncharacterized protein n=1 Tax=Sporothrix bragantina TaxID=671064 RepID=A0ABP0D001_9PEZI